MTTTSRIGGTAGPNWGTAFLKAGMSAGPRGLLTGEQVVAMLRAAVEGIKARGESDVGDKTLLDVLVPMTDRIEQEMQAGAASAQVVSAAAKDLGPLVQPGQPLYGIESTTEGRLVVFGGGVLLKTASGEVAGGVGVSAGTLEEDHRVAEAGRASFAG